jgi:surfeit locus 1 family protein
LKNGSISQPIRLSDGSNSNMIKPLFTSRRIWLTLVVLVAAGVMVRLGFWQLDRLAQRKSANALIASQISAPVLNLNAVSALDPLLEMEYRSVVVTGKYDFSQEVVIKNQVNGDKIGFGLLTPLKIQGKNYSVLIDRGWIPYEDALPSQWQKYAEPGLVTVNGVIRLSQDQPGFAGATDPTLTPSQARLDTWTFINIGRIQHQVSLNLLPVYIHQAPDLAWKGLPVRSLTLPDLSEGPHLGYAIQWFTFAATLIIGYPILVSRNQRKKMKELTS